MDLKVARLRGCAYNLQFFRPIFSFGLDGHKFGSGKQTIPADYGMIYRQLPVIEKSQPIAPKYEIKPGAQHRTLRGRKHVYKNIMGSDSGLIRQHIQVRATCGPVRQSYNSVINHPKVLH
ncbi:MAG: hypothetical protein WCW68_00285 [Methanothrix sp.]|jgi:hypothetical protein